MNFSTPSNSQKTSKYLNIQDPDIRLHKNKVENGVTDNSHSQELTPELQETLATLRQRTLLFWLEASRQKPLTIARLYENTTIEGRFQGTEAMERKLRFDNWNSPIGIYDRVVIREYRNFLGRKDQELE
ncbi:hypothetical protein G9A89_021399 [Geosiphon pyriformis]|nr:hypothetical protein G9A89_021399 [Geosiphon pyriformis]